VRPLCAAATAAISLPRAPLDAGEVRAALTGHSFQSAVTRLTFDRRGFLVGEAGALFDVGRWKSRTTGSPCRTWTVWDNARRRCYRVYRQGADGLELEDEDRWSDLQLRRLSGP
jgi:hypothetical protein